MRAALRLRHVEGVTRKGKFGGATLRVPRYTLRARGFSTQESGTFSAMKKCLTLLLLLSLMVAQRATAESALRAASLVHQETAQEVLGKDEHLEQREVTGKLVMIRKNSISVEYGQRGGDSYEMLLPLGKHVQFEHVKGLDALKRGDTVAVGYSELYRPGDDGKPVAVKTFATKITLVKSATDNPLRSLSAGVP